MGNYLDGYGKDTCGYCGLSRTPEGYDGCIGELKGGVMNACCGHGDDRCAYVQFSHSDYSKEPNKILIQGKKAIDYIKKNRNIIHT